LVAYLAYLVFALFLFFKPQARVVSLPTRPAHEHGHTSSVTHSVTNK
jgi:high-affinity iron transporter